jgi:hypothetical protein
MTTENTGIGQKKNILMVKFFSRMYMMMFPADFADFVLRDLRKNLR